MLGFLDSAVLQTLFPVNNTCVHLFIDPYEVNQSQLLETSLMFCNDCGYSPTLKCHCNCIEISAKPVNENYTDASTLISQTCRVEVHSSIQQVEHFMYR